VQDDSRQPNDASLLLIASVVGHEQWVLDLPLEN